MPLHAGIAMLAEVRNDRPLRDQDEHQEHRRPEGGQGRRKFLDHQVPDQHHHRQQEVQTRFQRRAGVRQVLDRRIRVVHVQFWITGTELQQADVGRHHHHADDIDRGITEDVLEPAKAVVNDAGKDDHSGNGHQEGNHALAQAGLVHVRNATDVGLHRFQVHDVEQRDVGDQRRQDGVLEHLRVGNADVLDHQESRSAHHRRHDLTVDRSRDLDGGGLVRTIADPLHERNGESSGGHDVGDRRPGNQPGACRSNDCRLGRTTTQVTEQRDGRLDEIVAGTGGFQKGAEQHEEEDEAR
jgi:hypothetical protein